MNEFSLIDHYFKSIIPTRDDVVLGIGDDAACLRLPNDMDLLVSTDTLVEGVHFLKSWDAYDIASRALRVNISDIAAMAATPCWVSLALTLPEADEQWLQRFSQGLADTLRQYDLALVGGDTTSGPLSITITIHGFSPRGCAVKRSGARVGDIIMVSGELGAAAHAVSVLNSTMKDEVAYKLLMDKLLHPKPRVDLIELMREHATAAIDISDGLSADLNHILESSHVGASLFLDKIPIHPLVCQYQQDKALDMALSGGDDYELCFTIPPASLEILERNCPDCKCIGIIEAEPGLRARATESANSVPLTVKGFSHF